MKGSITKRFYLRDWNKVRKSFPAEQGETAAHYFERLAKFLEDGRWRRNRK